MIFFNTAISILRVQNQNLILAWLSKTGLEIAGAKIMRLRLHYERKTWDDKYNGIQGLCQKISGDIQIARNTIQSFTSGTPMGNDAVTQLNALFRRDLPELHRLVDYEGRYAQNIAAEYFLKDLDDHRLVRRSMHILLGHLQQTLGQLGSVLLAMGDVWGDMGSSASFTKLVEDCEDMYVRLTSAQTAISNVTEILRGNTLDQRTGPHGPLAAVPTARRELKIGRHLRKAAMQEFAMISDDKLKRLIQTWINVISTSQHIRLDDPDADDEVVGGGTIAELKRAQDQAVADALAISLLERQDQAQANIEAGRQPAAEEEGAIHDLQKELQRVESESDIIDLYASFSDDERERLPGGSNNPGPMEG